MDWKKLLGQVAPVLGTAVGGPMGGLAMKFLANKLDGVDPEADDVEAQIERCLNGASPEYMLKVKQMDKDFEKYLGDLGIKKEELAVENTKDARAMANKSPNKYPQIAFSLIFIIGYFTLLGVVFWQLASPDSALATAPEWARSVLIMLIGMLTTELPRIMQFWFGSSSGSKDKGWKDLLSLAK